MESLIKKGVVARKKKALLLKKEEVAERGMKRVVERRLRSS